jgi:hypothetical protein
LKKILEARRTADSPVDLALAGQEEMCLRSLGLVVVLKKTRMVEVSWWELELLQVLLVVQMTKTPRLVVPKKQGVVARDLDSLPLVVGQALKRLERRYSEAR